jgi:hypothetical protein
MLENSPIFFTMYNSEIVSRPYVVKMNLLLASERF